MPKLIVSFVGGRPLPNILFILNEEPDEVYIIASKDSAKPGGNKEKLIDALPTSLQLADTLDVNPYSISETLECCRKILGKYSQHEIIFHLSSEPTTMSIAAFQSIIEAKSSNRCKLYYSSRDGVVDILLDNNNPQKLSISMDDYFRAYGWEIDKKQEVNEKYNQITELIVGNIETAQPLLAKMRKKGLTPNDVVLEVDRPTLSEIKFLDQMWMTRLLIDLQLKNDNRAVVKVDSTVSNFFLTGDWLEYFVFKTSMELSRETCFDESAWAVCDKAKKGELDFVGVKNGQLVIASCKTEKKITASNLQELSARADQLGKGMCTRLMISSNISKNKNQQYKKWESEYKLKIVDGYNLSFLKEILSNSINDRERI